MNAVQKSIERNMAKQLGERRTGSGYKPRAAAPSAGRSSGT